ncbi:hypothetical protein [Fodinicurvata fenggangensis]|uniref:hypothetical protein n=1 Tax=Fodinicurvata fenggangensis TaxID=1121830 RepID=UPI00047E85F9|nr:hypothetical protein [Fodinicurvata fenggangensis]
MTIFNDIREEVRQRLWADADQLEWTRLSDAEKSRQYSQWTEDPNIGGRLGAFMDPRKVRVYIKDTLLKSYTRERMADPRAAFRILGIPEDAVCFESFIKPNGCRLTDGRVVCWSLASYWKPTLLAVYERAYWISEASPHGAVLFHAADQFPNLRTRMMVEDIAARLEIQQLRWVE